MSSSIPSIMDSTFRIFRKLVIQSKSSFLLILILSFVALISGLLAIGKGAINIDYSQILSWLGQGLLVGSDGSSGAQVYLNEIQQKVILDIRLPRVLVAFAVGASLAIAGAVLQNITRNPLADPYLFGIASGASLGAVVFIAGFSFALTTNFADFFVNTEDMNGDDLRGILNRAGVTFFALIGSVLSAILVLSLAGIGAQIERMLLAGVAVNFLFAAGTSLVLYFSDPLASSSFLFWSMGSFSRVGWDDIPLIYATLLLSLFVFLGSYRFIQGLLAGDEAALALGIRPQRLRLILLLFCSALTAVVVAHCGGIGFVGLMIPHVVRRLMGRNSGSSLVVTALVGGIFMIWVDVFARSVIDQAELPIGVITGLIGSVFFIFILKGRSRLQKS